NPSTTRPSPTRAGRQARQEYTMSAVATLTGELPQEERERVDADEAYHRLLARLSHQSVVKHFDAYADVPWDDPAYAIDPSDPRFELSERDALGATAWYRSQPQ